MIFSPTLLFLPKEFDIIGERLCKIEHQLSIANKRIDHIPEIIEKHALEKDNTEIQNLEDYTSNCINTLSTEIHEYMASNFALKGQAPTAYSSPATHSNEPSLKLRDPESFNGKPSACNAFFLIFAANENRFRSDESKTLFAISHLAGNAFAYMEPYLSKLDAPEYDRPSILTSFGSFKKAIVNAFNDSNPVVNAEAAIRTLRQAGPTSAHATEFRSLSMMLSWNEPALISQYVLHLKDGIKDELARRDPVYNLDSLISSSIDIDNSLYNRNKQRKQQTSVGNNPRQQQHQNYRQQLAQQTAVVPSLKSRESDVSEPMDLGSASVNRIGPLTEKQKQYRRANNLCLYCGKGGHYNNNCPKKKQNNSISTIILTDNNYLTTRLSSK